MTDLNTLLIPGSTLFLVDVNSISSAGELVGDAIDLRTREQHAYLAIPVRGEVVNDAISAESVGTLDPVLSESTRQILEQRYRIPGPQATLSPTTLTFNTTSAVQPVTLTNNGNGTLNIANITISTNFAETNDCGPAFTLASKASCTINVRFTATTTGTLEGTLSVSDNTMNSPQTVSLTGNTSGRCTPEGMECPPQFPPCCPGLTCVPASSRAFCLAI